MAATTTGYNDFSSLVGEIDHRASIFYVESAGVFQTYAFTTSGVIVRSDNLTTKPMTFDSDFPNAILLNNALGIT